MSENIKISERNLRKVDKALAIFKAKVLAELKKKSTGSVHFSVDISEGGVKDRCLSDMRESHNLSS